MHTKDKWIVKQNKASRRYDISDKIGRFAEVYHIDSNIAKQIVQMHNSFDDLLKTAKEAVYALENPIAGDLVSAKNGLKQAIAVAEENNE